jgi:hypothetical protein
MDQSTPSHGPLSVVGHVKVAKHAILATIHAHWSNPDTILKSFAPDSDRSEGRGDRIFGDAVLGIKNCGADWYPLLWREEREASDYFTAKV